MQRIEHVIAEIDQCTGCNMCTLACSMAQKGAFNPRYSKIKVHQELIGLVTKIEFIEQCDMSLLSQCNLIDSEPLCTKYCIFDAIKFKKVED
ncbi:hypothetical protein BMS3Abin06_01493 [bacterium BMS3Abin06]|nr:hypothetical protein BMS3Abin06_01493 [bacterium BMS3Abin06]